MTGATSVLSIKDLTFRYPGSGSSPGEGGGGRWVVDVSSLEVSAGEQVLLTGGSGRGKSTLLYLIAGLLEPVSGTVLIGGQPMHGLHGARRDLFRGRSIGMIFQTFNLLQGFSALENVLAALMFSSVPAREHGERARALLRKLGIEHPDRDPDRLSVGQQQRVAVARAIACGPALVLADEPTASLDPENARSAMDTIQGACRESGAALVCVSHDPSMEDRFARRLSFDALSSGAAQGAVREGPAWR